MKNSLGTEKCNHLKMQCFSRIFFVKTLKRKKYDVVATAFDVSSTARDALLTSPSRQEVFKYQILAKISIYYVYQSKDINPK